MPETGLTFAENALLKAREGARYTGLPTVADDSGLAVDALNGMPGVFSARWSGGHGDDKANLDLVLAQIGDVPDEHRGAAFVCAAALVLPGGREHLVEGRQTGRLLRAPRGTGGFGYDPIFVGDGQDRTNAELTPDGEGRDQPPRQGVARAGQGDREEPAPLTARKVRRAPPPRRRWRRRAGRSRRSRGARARSPASRRR